MTRTESNKPIDYTLLSSRSIIVTGGSSGLGEAISTQFARSGAFVTIADFNATLGNALATKLTSQGYKVSFVQTDTTDWESSVQAFRHAVKFGGGRLDVAALFAGTDGEAKGLIDIVASLPPPTFDEEAGLGPRPPLKAVDVNMYGVYLSTYLALYYFRLGQEQGGQEFKKSLILVSSMMGYIDCPYNTGYAMSKYGVRGLFRSIRPQAHRLGVRVNNIAPAYVLTPLTKKIHKIEDPKEPSKATGFVLPWAPIEGVVGAVGLCACDEGVDGECFAELLYCLR